MEHFHAIDVFFQSLAVDRVDHAVGVIVSGSGTMAPRHGTIREQGGLIDRSTGLSSARCPDMPLQLYPRMALPTLSTCRKTCGTHHQHVRIHGCPGRDGNGVADTDGRWLAEIQALVQQTHRAGFLRTSTTRSIVASNVAWDCCVNPP